MMFPTQRIPLLCLPELKAGCLRRQHNDHVETQALCWNGNGLRWSALVPKVDPPPPKTSFLTTSTSMVIPTSLARQNLTVSLPAFELILHIVTLFTYHNYCEADGYLELCALPVTALKEAWL